MKKKQLEILSIAAALMMLCAGMLGCQRGPDNAGILIDGIEYPLDSTTLDLSGTVLTEAEKLAQLQQLQQLDLRNTGITAAQYEMLHGALPGCEIFWSIPLQGSYFESSATELDLPEISESDLNTLRYLPNLTCLRVSACPEPEVLAALETQYPNIDIFYTLSLNGSEYDSTVQELTLTAPDADELLEKLRYLPDVRSVRLEGALPGTDRLLALKEAYPDILFSWDFELFGIATCSTAEFLDLSGLAVTVPELEAWLPCFYNLQKVDMVGCGLTNEEMDGLNRDHPGTRFIWEVVVCTVPVRTDITYFMPVKYDLRDHKTNDFSALRYCTDIVVIDLGHYVVNDLSFVEYLPKLEYLQLCSATIDDISSIGKCTSLRMLELFLNPVTDFWPLTNLTNLEDLNISYTPCLTRYEPRKYGNLGDITPLLQMTWLDRLWVAGHIITEEEQQALRDALPNTVMHFEPGSSTNHGWRYCPNYYTARDILEMWYMHI